jgi:hypothetical protein
MCVPPRRVEAAHEGEASGRGRGRCAARPPWRRPGAGGARMPPTNAAASTRFFRRHHAHRSGNGDLRRDAGGRRPLRPGWACWRWGAARRAPTKTPCSCSPSSAVCEVAMLATRPWSAPIRKSQEPPGHPREDAASAVGAVGGRRQPQDEDPRRRIAVTRDRTSPVRVVPVGGPLRAGDARAVGAQARAVGARHDGLSRQPEGPRADNLQWWLWRHLGPRGWASRV